jgi:hypothetical protein
MSKTPWITKAINVLTIKALGLPVNIDTGEWTMNCSETVSRVVRAGGVNVLPGVDADCITPMDLVRWFVSNGYEPNKLKGDNNMSDVNTTTETTSTAEVAATVESATSTAAAEAAVALASSATTTAQVINAAVTTIAADSHAGIAEKIEALANEIKTTKSLWVKIRNTVEIGTLSVLLSKAASAVSEKVSDLK